MIDLVRSGRSRREAAAIVAAEREEARRRLPPQPVHEVHPLAEQWLAVCRAPCEHYRRAGTAEYCELDACGDDGRRCVSAAVQTWTARLFGQAPPCLKQSREPRAESRLSALRSPLSAFGFPLAAPPLDPDTWITTARLAADTARLASLLPPLDAVLGIARSGLMPAAQIAALHHAPLLSIGSFGPGPSAIRDCGGGWRMLGQDRPVRRVAVVDDTTAHGIAMRNSAAAARGRWPRAEILRAVVYAHPSTLAELDYWAEILPGPHYLAWNLFNAQHGETLATDLDGVLCPDPPFERSDEDPVYLDAIRSAPVWQRPRRRRLPLIVTARLEKWRGETEAWLARAGIQYGRLVMGPWATIHQRNEDWPDKAVRLKADAYLTSGCKLFVESDPIQARRIVEATGLAVLCPAAGRVLRPQLPTPNSQPPTSLP